MCLLRNVLFLIWLSCVWINSKGSNGEVVRAMQKHDLQTSEVHNANQTIKVIKFNGRNATTTNASQKNYAKSSSEPKTAKRIRKTRKRKMNINDLPTVQNQSLPKLLPSAATWTQWGLWSVCTRSCGGGIQTQERKCIRGNSSGKSSNSMIYLDNKYCSGIYKKFKLCNEQDCENSEVNDYRAEQCSSYNNRSFGGKFYSWTPYIYDKRECELNCKPLDMGYFATLNHATADGTPCIRSAEFFQSNYRGPSVCIDSICLAIQTNQIQGIYAINNTIPCGSLVCKPISGVFGKAILPHGYMRITTIPSGANNITIKELQSSRNMIVLKTTDNTYIINGKLGTTSSGSYEAANTIFHYNRIENTVGGASSERGISVTEWVTAEGPTTEPVDLMILVQDINHGVKYEYYVPISPTSSEEDYAYNDYVYNDIDNAIDSGEKKTNSVDDDGIQEATMARSLPKKRFKFQWAVIGFGSCSRSCGGGTQTPIFRCIRDSPTRFYSTRRCANIEKPAFNDAIYRCNTQPCPPYWHAEEWKTCSCHHHEGVQRRQVRCVQEVGTAVIVQVDSESCPEDKPFEKRTCECPKKRKHHSGYRVGQYQKPRMQSHSRGTQSTVPYKRPKYENNGKSGIWVKSIWSNQCSNECGFGTEYRTIFCDRNPPHIDRCDLRITPDTARTCENYSNCKTGEWFTGRWGHCNGDCFNLQRSREVVCMSDKVVVDDELCLPHKKPEPIKNCTQNEVPYCKARWHYSEWSECTKTCGTGSQRRRVICLEFDASKGILMESSNCRYTEREPLYAACNTHKCPEMNNYPRVDLIQNDLAPICEDKSSRCSYVIQAKLCLTEYYQEMCCYSCGISRG